MSEAMKAETDSPEVEALADSIAGCFSNVMDLPEWMQIHALGRYMRPLVLIAARAVIASDWFASVRCECCHGVCACGGKRVSTPARPDGGEQS